MDNGIYIMLSRQVGLFQDMAVLANNIANVNTTGYQAQRLLFNEYLVKEGNIESAKNQKMAFADGATSWQDNTNGPIRVTNNPLDVALQGEGYFAVETPLGTRYTRAGNFTINAEGTLVTQEGYPVLDNANKHINFDPETKEIAIGGAGNITQDGAELGILGVYSFDNPQELQRAGDTLFRADAEAKPVIAPRVSQGTLEGANVQAVLELTHMIDISRSVGSTAKYIDTMYDLQRKTSNTYAQQS